MISGLYTTDNNQNINFDRPVKAVAIDPMFYKSGSGRHFVTGDDKVHIQDNDLGINESYFVSNII